jgi:hypothetical protein
MPLTTAQKATLKAAITANTTWAAYPMTGDGYFDLARELNKEASPAFVVWRTSVSVTETGKAFNGAEWAGMTSANHTRLQTVAQFSAAGYNAALADIRAMFNDIWSGAGGAITRASLLMIWKRNAKYGEKILSTGTGSDASPATMGFEGDLTDTDVRETRNS